MKFGSNPRGRPLRAAAGVLATGVALPALALGADGAEPGHALGMTVRDRHLTSGQALEARGRAGRDDAHRRVVLEYRAGGAKAWRPVAAGRTQPGGLYRLRARVRSSGQARVVLPPAPAEAGSPGAPARTSAPRRVSVAARVVTGTRDLDVTWGSPTAVRGRLVPGRAGRTVRLEYISRDGWRTLDRARTERHGAFELGWRARRLGSLRVRVAFGGDEHNRAARAPSRRLDVFRAARATWYALIGNSLACGGRMHSWTLGVAHKTLPCGTPLTLRYRGREVSVRVIDRGPFSSSLDYDLTSATKRRLGYGDIGTVLATR